MRYFAGLDWGAAVHAICVIDDAGRVLAPFEIEHAAEGIEAMLARLARIAPAAALPIAIERPSGLIVDALIEAGHPVVPIHPNVVKACRPRYRAAGGKSDPGDAYMLADILRTDGHQFRALEACCDEIKALRILLRSRDDLVAQRIALANRLRSLLDGFWLGAAAIFADVDSPIALAFLARYPTPDSAGRLGKKRLAAFLAQHPYSGRRSPAELLERLRAKPPGRAGEAQNEGAGEVVRSLVVVLGVLVAELPKLTARLEHAVAELADGAIVMSFPRTGRICAAQILAELGDVRGRFQTEQQLAAEAGVCPVTYASGKSRGVVFRWACNHRLRRAITCFADNSRHASPWAAAIYKAARRRGGAWLDVGLDQFVPVPGAVGFALPFLIRDRDIMLGLPRRGDAQVEGGAQRHGHGRCRLIRSSARSEQLVEEVAEPCLEHIHFGIADRHSVGPIAVTVQVERSCFGGRPRRGQGTGWM